MAPTFALYHKDTNGASWVVCEDTNPAVVRDALYDTRCKNVVEYPGFAGFEIKICVDNSTTVIRMDFRTLEDTQKYMNDAVDQMSKKSSGALAQPKPVDKEPETYTLEVYSIYKGNKIATPFISTPTTAEELKKLGDSNSKPIELIKPHVEKVNEAKKANLLSVILKYGGFKSDSEFTDYILKNLGRDDIYVNEATQWEFTRVKATRVFDNQIMFDAPFVNYQSNVECLD